MSGLSEDRRLWREGEIGVVGPREQSNGGEGGEERPQPRSEAKQGQGEVEPFLLGWHPRGQGYKPDPG